MEIYEKIEIEIENIGNEDVITTSSEHDNAYIDFSELFNFMADVFDIEEATGTVNMDSANNSDILE